jgi:hypothetical protein
VAKTVVRGATNDADKVFVLAQYVQTNYTYKALEFGRRALLPHRTAEIIRNQYGDCKDHALLMHQLLTASGVPASLALVNTQGKVRREIPSLDQFDHMVVYLPTIQNGIFLDCTDKGSDLAQLVPLGLAGKDALVLDAARPRFITVPDYPDGCNLISSRREVSISNQTDSVVHEVLTLKGYQGSLLRNYLKQLQPEDRRNFVEAQMSRRSGEVTGFKVQNLQDTQAPLVLEMDYVLMRQFHLVGERLVGNLPDVWEELYLSAESVENRLKPFELSFPMKVESKITFAIPAGFRAISVDGLRQSVKTAFASSSSEANKAASALKLEFQMQRRAGRFSATEYGSFRESMVKGLAPLKQSVEFIKEP